VIAHHNECDFLARFWRERFAGGFETGVKQVLAAARPQGARGRGTRHPWHSFRDAGILWRAGNEQAWFVMIFFDFIRGSQISP